MMSSGSRSVFHGFSEFNDIIVNSTRLPMRNWHRCYENAPMKLNTRNKQICETIHLQMQIASNGYSADRNMHLQVVCLTIVCQWRVLLRICEMERCRRIHDDRGAAVIGFS